MSRHAHLAVVVVIAGVLLGTLGFVPPPAPPQAVTPTAAPTATRAAPTTAHPTATPHATATATTTATPLPSPTLRRGTAAPLSGTAPTANLLAVWGRNASCPDCSDGDFGDGGVASSTTPVSVSAWGTVIAVAAGGGFTVALHPDGTVWTAGGGSAGQLGDGSFANANLPV